MQSNKLRIVCLVFLLAVPGLCFSQNSPAAGTGPVTSSPAYSEVLLRKTDLLADLESFLADYTEANPKILDLRFEIGVLDRSMARILAVKPAEAGKLTLALGKLLVRHASLETDLARLSRTFSKEHTEVMRAKKRVEIFDNAIKEILR